MNRFVTFAAVALLLALLSTPNGVSAQFPTCDATTSWQLFPDPTTCERYYRCENNRAILYTCPDHQLYDHQMRGCNAEQNVECKLSPITTCPPHNPAQADYLPHATDCSQFFKCWDGVPHLMGCPEGLLWNQAVGYCDFANNVVCRIQQE